jgi:hypothetical protein
VLAGLGRPLAHLAGGLLLGRQLGGVAALQHLPAQRIDGLALLVHDVVVLEQVLADVEVVALDLLLRVLDGPVDERVLDGDVLFHPQALHQAGDPLGAEDAHQVVFERKIEARAARVALAAGAAAELVVDAAGLVALGAEDVQAAGGEHLAFSASHWGLNFAKATLNFSWIDLGARLARGLGIHLGARHELGVAAEDDVRATAGHVGGDRDRALAARLRHDVRLALVLLGVQHVVRDALLAQQRRHHLGLLHADGADQHRLAALVAVLDLGQHARNFPFSFL